MQMVLCPLASGSSGNCVYLAMDRTGILIDAGISASRIKDGLAQLGVDPRLLSGIVVTHEHADHVKGLRVFCKKYGTPLYVNDGTWTGILSRDGGFPEEVRIPFETGKSFRIGKILVHPFPIPHDAADPVGFRFTCENLKCGVATDLGHLDERWLSELEGCQALVLESNHDEDMVRYGPYPMHLKQRILSPKGHLNNQDCGKALTYLCRRGTQAVYLAHLSQENNLPELACSTVYNILDQEGICAGRDVFVGIARRDEPSDAIIMGK